MTSKEDFFLKYLSGIKAAAPLTRSCLGLESPYKRIFINNHISQELVTVKKQALDLERDNKSIESLQDIIWYALRRKIPGTVSLRHSSLTPPASASICSKLNCTLFSSLDDDLLIVFYWLLDFLIFFLDLRSIKFTHSIFLDLNHCSFRSFCISFDFFFLVLHWYGSWGDIYSEFRSFNQQPHKISFCWILIRWGTNCCRFDWNMGRAWNSEFL